ncbi:MAG: hypothetical protein N4A33_05285 [Bacteriovoracaceae bacterium]|jgi:uncharacterized metal-binding protein YceD (DUF177 family)|nr:hypothetical protein [Bacteriovoracaceae bacterium]
MNNIFDVDNTTGEYNITKFQVNKEIAHMFNKETIWIKDLLIELNENADEKSSEAYLLETDIQVRFNLIKKFKNTIGEYIILNGNIDVEYVTKCVKTLQDMRETIKEEFKLCFVDFALESSDEFSEQTEIFIENEMHELYFYSERKMSLKEVINELIYLNVDQYPCLDKETEYDDAGINLKQ